MKIQPIMEDQFAIYYSDLTTTSPDHVQFDTAYSSPTVMVEELHHPAAKTINVLSPEKRSFVESSSSSDFEISTANKIYTKELISSNTVDQARETETLSEYGVSTFDRDMHECHIAEKVNRLKAEGNPTTAKTSTKKGVRFSSITIQEYSLQPGVNPGGTKGCPLTIGWKPISKDTLDLDVFESVRTKHRRNHDQLKLVSIHREQVLREMGYTMRDIMEGTKEATRARRHRYSTIARLKSTDSQEIIEDLQRNVQNLVSFGSKRRKERKFLAPYLLDEKNMSSSGGGLRMPQLAPAKSKFSSIARVSAEEIF